MKSKCNFYRNLQKIVLILSAAVLLFSGCEDATTPPDTGELIYVSSLARNKVSLIDVESNKVVATVRSGFNPVVLAITCNGRKIYSANFETSYVTVMNTATLATRRIEIGGFPFAVVMSHDSSKVYVPYDAHTTDYSKLAVIDVKTDTVVRQFNFDVKNLLPFGVEESPDGKILYISFINNTVAAYDAETGEIIHEHISCGGKMPAWISLSPDGSTLYSLNFFSGNTAVFDTDLWEKKADIQGAADSRPITAATSPDQSKLYIAGGDGVTVVDTDTYEIIGKIETEGSASGVCFTKDGYGYVSDTGKSSLTTGLLALSGLGSMVGTTPGIVRSFDPATDTYIEEGIEVLPIPGVIVSGTDRRIFKK